LKLFTGVKQILMIPVMSISSIISRKERKVREDPTISVSFFALCNTFFYHEGHEEHEGFVCSKS
jgi:hypothetical protein